MQTTLDTFVRVLPKFRCVFCNKACISSLDVACHVQTHTFVTCRQCPAIFLNAQDRIQHEEDHVHTTRKRSAESLGRVSGRTFRCERCNRNYATQEALDADIAAHDSSKRTKWTCEHCPNTPFASKDNLRRHVAKKHGSRCKHCDIPCTTLESRRDHEALHKDAMYGFMHVCEEVPLCQTRCATKEQLAFHIKTNHSDEELVGGQTWEDTENKLALFLQSRDIAFTRDWSNRVVLPSDCRTNSARPDFYLHAKSKEAGVAILIDNDEHQHKRYTGELERMRDIERVLQDDEEWKDKPILFVRFNPNTYKIDTATKTQHIDKAHESLLTNIDLCLQKPLHKGLNLLYMYYDTSRGQLDCFQHQIDSSLKTLFQHKILHVVT